MKVKVVRKSVGFAATVEQIEDMIRAMCNGTIPNVSTQQVKDGKPDPAGQMIQESEQFGGVESWLTNTLKNKMKELEKEGRVRIEPDTLTPGMLSNLALTAERKWILGEDRYLVSAGPFHIQDPSVTDEVVEDNFATYLGTERGLLIYVLAEMAVVGRRFVIDLHPVIEGIKPFLMNERFGEVTGEGLAGGCLFFSEQHRGSLPSDLLIYSTPDLKVNMSFSGADVMDRQDISVAGSRLSGNLHDVNQGASLRFAFMQDREHVADLPLLGENRQKAEELVEKLVPVLEAIEPPESL